MNLHWLGGGSCTTVFVRLQSYISWIWAFSNLEAPPFCLLPTQGLGTVCTLHSVKAWAAVWSLDTGQKDLYDRQCVFYSYFIYGYFFFFLSFFLSLLLPWTQLWTVCTNRAIEIHRIRTHRPGSKAVDRWRPCFLLLHTYTSYIHRIHMIHRY